MNFQTISVNDIEKILTKYKAILVDLRSGEDYAKYHFEGALNVPYEELDRMKSLFTKEKSYILYCERGGSSLLAAKELSNEGYKIYTVIGGIRAWEEKDMNWE